MAGKNINYFLMDGLPSGRIKCTIANWTGVAYRIPRTTLEKCKERDDLKQSGVYFLFGTDEETGDDVAYIGQAGIRKSGEGVLNRLQEHKRDADKDYWDHAIVFTTSNNSFGPTEISWLENRFCTLANEAGRYVIKNGNDPSPGNVTEEKQSELEEFIDYARIVMGVLGHMALETLSPRSTIKSDTSKTQDDNLLLYLQQGDIKATCVRTTEGFVVQKGSVIKSEDAKSLQPSVKQRRKNAKISDSILQEDVLFASPSYAAQFVLGRSASGPMEWKTADYKSLKDIETET
ncbi:MAG: GIY-YIG nuclease family protein [Defluviitaleaceae bacterium]|nr:GIY-YIG nuclease family protein [Defluviitaleaceae bacterium]